MNDGMNDEIVKQVWRVVLIAIAMSLGSCTSKAPATSSSSSPSVPGRKVLQVVTTFIPITDFTQAVAGDRAHVTQLLPTNVGPHDYQAKPEDAQKLAKADVLVENGLGMEEFLEELIKNAGNTNLKIIDSSQGIRTLSTAAFADKQQNQAHPIAFNPHIWLDPKRAIQQVETIRQGLIAADLPGKEIYTKNAAAYITKLQQLDRELTQKLRPFAGKTFVTYHDFAPYFAQSYALNVQFLVGIPEENASPADVKRVITAAKDSKLKTLLTEPQAIGNPFSALAQDLHVQIGNFDPMETAIAAGVQPDYYITVMRQNALQLEAALGKSPPQSFFQHQLPSRFLARGPQPIRLWF